MTLNKKPYFSLFIGLIIENEDPIIYNLLLTAQ